MLNSNDLIIVFSIIIIFSYVFNIIAEYLKVPSVILLISAGILLNYLSTTFNLEFILPKVALEVIGTMGLILIVLEASLDLKLTKYELPILRKAFLAALIILFISSFIIAFIIKFWLNTSFKGAFINSIPMAVISSAIAIPSVTMLSKELREFIIYEATFSDILGIMIFNYSIQERTLHYLTFQTFILNLVLLIVLSFAGSLVLLFFLNKIKSHVKFVLIIAILLLIYSIGKAFHLPSLLLVLIFGVMINNATKFLPEKIAAHINSEHLENDFIGFKSITAEIAFVIRTFFFVLFGFSLNLQEIIDPKIVYIGSAVIGIILLIRFIYIKFVLKKFSLEKLFIAPRGLISVILFYSIPAKYIIPDFSVGILFFVIIMSSLVMMAGLWMSKKL